MLINNLYRKVFIINDYTASIFTHGVCRPRDGDKSCARNREAALKIDALQNARLDYCAPYQNESASWIIRHGVIYDSIRPRPLPRIRTHTHTQSPVIPLIRHQSFVPINILSETQRCRFQWKQKLIVSQRRGRIQKEEGGGKKEFRADEKLGGMKPKSSEPPIVKRKDGNRGLVRATILSPFCGRTSEMSKSLNIHLINAHTISDTVAQLRTLWQL